MGVALSIDIFDPHIGLYVDRYHGFDYAVGKLKGVNCSIVIIHTLMVHISLAGDQIVQSISSKKSP